MYVCREAMSDVGDSRHVTKTNESFTVGVAAP